MATSTKAAVLVSFPPVAAHRTPLGIYRLSFFSLFSFRFSFGLRWAFFCCSLLPLSRFPLSPISLPPCLSMTCAGLACKPTMSVQTGHAREVARSSSNAVHAAPPDHEPFHHSLSQRRMSPAPPGVAEERAEGDDAYSEGTGQ